MFIKKLLTLVLIRIVLLPHSITISLIDNIIEQVSVRIDLLKITYNRSDFGSQDMVTSILSKRSDIPFSVNTVKPSFFGKNFISLLFVEDFRDLK